ncbi:MAG: hypothetical protein ACRDQW_00560 [Haloechinothrix sp.]
MDTFEFTLRLNQRIAEESEMDIVYAQCADCSLLVEGEVTLLRFHREAKSLKEAIRSAIADVNAAGYHVAHVEMEPDSVTTQTA